MNPFGSNLPVRASGPASVEPQVPHGQDPEQFHAVSAFVGDVLNRLAARGITDVSISFSAYRSGDFGHHAPVTIENIGGNGAGVREAVRAALETHGARLDAVDGVRLSFLEGSRDSVMGAGPPSYDHADFLNLEETHELLTDRRWQELGTRVDHVGMQQLVTPQSKWGSLGSGESSTQPRHLAPPPPSLSGLDVLGATEPNTTAPNSQLAADLRNALDAYVSTPKFDTAAPLTKLLKSAKGNPAGLEELLKEILALGSAPKHQMLLSDALAVARGLQAGEQVNTGSRIGSLRPMAKVDQSVGVGMGEGATAVRGCKNPLIGSGGAADCIIVSGYNPTTGRAFVFHAHRETDPTELAKKLKETVGSHGVQLDLTSQIFLDPNHGDSALFQSITAALGAQGIMSPPTLHPTSSFAINVNTGQVSTGFQGLLNFARSRDLSNATADIDIIYKGTKENSFI